MIQAPGKLQLNRSINVPCFSLRYADFKCIHSQLKSCKVNKMAALLEAVESCYHAAFMNMQQDVLAGNLTTDNKLNEVCFLRCNMFLFFKGQRTRCFIFLLVVKLTLITSSFAALEEAEDICTYLRPLQPLFTDMENVEIPAVKGLIGPLMHTVCLVWANSRYYNTPARLIVLLQETCNLLIQQVSCSFCSLSACFVEMTFVFIIQFGSV